MTKTKKKKLRKKIDDCFPISPPNIYKRGLSFFPSWLKPFPLSWFGVSLDWLVYITPKIKFMNFFLAIVGEDLFVPSLVSLSIPRVWNRFHHQSFFGKESASYTGRSFSGELLPLSIYRSFATYCFWQFNKLAFFVTGSYCDCFGAGFSRFFWKRTHSKKILLLVTNMTFTLESC